MSREYLGRREGANMADESEEVNTAVEDGEAKQLEDEPRVSETGPDDETGDGHGQAEKSAAESSWSAPLLSLARKATETISSGVSYAPRNSAQGSAVSSPAEKEPENELNNSKKLPGKCELLETLDCLTNPPSLI